MLLQYLFCAQTHIQCTLGEWLQGERLLLLFSSCKPSSHRCRERSRNFCASVAFDQGINLSVVGINRRAIGPSLIHTGGDKAKGSWQFDSCSSDLQSLGWEAWGNQGGFPAPLGVGEVWEREEGRESGEVMAN